MQEKLLKILKRWDILLVVFLFIECRFADKGFKNDFRLIGLLLSSIFLVYKYSPFRKSANSCDFKSRKFQNFELLTFLGCFLLLFNFKVSLRGPLIHESLSLPFGFDKLSFLPTFPEGFRIGSKLISSFFDEIFSQVIFWGEKLQLVQTQNLNLGLLFSTFIMLLPTYFVIKRRLSYGLESIAMIFLLTFVWIGQFQAGYIFNTFFLEYDYAAISALFLSMYYITKYEFHKIKLFIFLLILFQLFFENLGFVFGFSAFLYYLVLNHKETLVKKTYPLFIYGVISAAFAGGVYFVLTYNQTEIAFGGTGRKMSDLFEIYGKHNSREHIFTSIRLLFFRPILLSFLTGFTLSFFMKRKYDYDFIFKQFLCCIFIGVSFYFCIMVGCLISGLNSEIGRQIMPILSLSVFCFYLLGILFNELFLRGVKRFILI